MPEIIKDCPLCGSERHQTFEITNFRGFEVVNQICILCGFVFQSPRMTEDESERFYAKSYRQVYQGDEEPNQKDLLIQRERAAVLLGLAQRSIPIIHRHLDIGSSAGILLETFHTHYGCYSTGIEPGDSYRVFSASKGLAVYANLSALDTMEDSTFDLISMAHVLEHIPDPVSYLAQIKQQYIRPGGYLLIEVPNLYSHDSFEVAHMSSFSGHTLKQTLKKSGFTIIDVIKHGQPRSELLPLYLTVIARTGDIPLEPVVEPEKWVAAKRKIGIISRRILQRLLPKKAWKPIKTYG